GAPFGRRAMTTVVTAVSSPGEEPPGGVASEILWRGGGRVFRGPPPRPAGPGGPPKAPPGGPPRGRRARPGRGGPRAGPRCAVAGLGLPEGGGGLAGGDGVRRPARAHPGHLAPPRPPPVAPPPSAT